MKKEDLIVCFQDTFEKSNNGSLKQRTAQAVKSNRVYKEGFISKKSTAMKVRLLMCIPEQHLM